MGGLERIVNKVEDYFIEHPKTASIAYSTGLTLVGFKVLDTVQSTSGVDLAGELYAGTALGFLGIGYLTYKNLKANKTLKKLGLNYKSLKKKLLKKNTKEENQTLTQKIKDFSFDHYKSSGFVVGTAIYASAIWSGIISNVGFDGFVNRLHQQPDYGYLMLFFEVGLVTCFSYLFKYSSYNLRSSSSKFTNKFSEMYIKEFFFSKEKMIGEYEKFQKKTNHSIFTFKQAKIASELGLVNKSFELLLNIYDKLGIESVKYSDTDRAPKLMSYMIHNSYSNIQNNPNSFSDYFFLSLLLKGIGEKQKSLDVMTNFIREADKSDYDVKLNANLSYAVFLRKTAETQKFKEQFVKILKLYSKDLKQIGSYKAYLLEENDFSKKTFVIRKSDDETTLLSEKEFNEKIKTKFDNVNDEDNFKIIDPPEVVKFQDEFYSATFYENGVALYDYLNSESDLKVFEKIARFMGRIHSANETYKPIDDSVYINQLFFRIDQAKNPKLENLKKIIKDNIYSLFTGFKKFSRVVDIDGHRENWIVGKNYTKIDNQAREPTIPFYECSKLLEQGNTIPLNEEGDRIKDNILKNYYDEISNFQPQVSFDEFLFYKLKSDSIKAISYYFFAHDDLTKQKTAKKFLENSIHSIDRLVNNYSSEVNLEHLKNLKEAELELVEN